MKKSALTLAIILGLATAGIAQQKGGGVFERGGGLEFNSYESTVMLPTEHGSVKDFDADAPLGGGIAVLFGLGAAYLVGKKRREE